MRKRIPRLDPDENSWLDAYRNALAERHPGAVHRLLIYGSKARGDCHPESDLDVLLIVEDTARDLKRRLRQIGYGLATTSLVTPSILAYTQKEWEERKRLGFPFQLAVEHEAISVL